MAKSESDFRITTDTPYITLTGELLYEVSIVKILEKIDRVITTPLGIITIEQSLTPSCFFLIYTVHYSDVIMGAMWSQIIGVSIVYCSSANQDSRFKIQKHLFDNVQTSIIQINGTMWKNESNISWWVHVWRPSLRPYGRYHKGHQRMFGSTGRIKVSRYDSNNNNNNNKIMPKGINAMTMPSGE